MRFLSFTSFSSLIKEIKRCDRKKPQAEGSLHFTIVELLEELDQRTKELQQKQQDAIEAYTWPSWCHPYLRIFWVRCV